MLQNFIGEHFSVAGQCELLYWVGIIFRVVQVSYPTETSSHCLLLGLEISFVCSQWSSHVPDLVAGVSSALYCQVKRTVRLVHVLRTVALKCFVGLNWALVGFHTMSSNFYNGLISFT